MLLNGDEIKRLNLIENASNQMFKAASYNLRVGKILTIDGKVATSYELPSLGMIEVISEEKVHVPKNVAGYATVKTGLCNEGILAINIGIVDPGYNGLLSSTLINFGKNTYLLNRGQEFLRVTFHQYPAQEEIPPVPAQKLDAEYIKERITMVLAHFSATFLNIEEKTTLITNRVAGQVLGRWKKGFFVWIPIAALALALITFLFNYGTLVLNEKYIKEAMKNEIKIDLIKEQQGKASAAGTDSRIGAVEQKLRELDEAVRAMEAKGGKQGANAPNSH